VTPSNNASKLPAHRSAPRTTVPVALQEGACVPSQRAVLVATWTPVAALALAVTWSSLAALLLSGEPNSLVRLTFWGGDVPIMLFGVPAAAVWLWTSVYSASKRQGWQVLMLAAYYGAALIVTLLGLVMVA
jgi:hypothetical protein